MSKHTSDESKQSTDVSSEVSAQSQPDESYTPQEFSQDAINDGVASINCTITFGTTLTVSGSGAKADGNNITITKQGTYAVKGKCDDCRITVEATKDDQIEIVLYDANLSSKSGPVIVGTKSDRIKVIVPEGTASVISDAANYTYSGDANAAIWSKDDLTIKGNGSLTVNGNFNNGISSTNDIKIVCADLKVNAADNGIRGKDSVEVDSGSVITVKAGGAGIKSSETDDPAKGYVTLNGGIINIESTEDAINATTLVTVGNCRLNIVAGDGSTKVYDDGMSRKGIKAGKGIIVNAGFIDSKSNDDALHSKGYVTVNGGEITVATGDDAIHADTALTVNNGSITVTESYEGLEGQSVSIRGGSISIISVDDGINTSGEGGDNALVISGGNVYVNTDGDGLDSNGQLIVSGGTLLVDGPSSDQNKALDSTAGLCITGGTVIAVNAVAIDSATASGTTQVTLGVRLGKTIAAGSKLSVMDGDTVIYEFTPAKEYSYAVISCPALKLGTVYTVKAGDTTVSITAVGAFSGN